jgi:hypothetical protein
MNGRYERGGDRWLSVSVERLEYLYHEANDTYTNSFADLTNYLDGSVQVDRIPVSNLVVFASVRYAGNAAAMSSIEATSGRVVINSLASPPSAQK